MEEEEGRTVEDVAEVDAVEAEEEEVDVAEGVDEVKVGEADQTAVGGEGKTIAHPRCRFAYFGWIL